jgi:hypothetical protein
VTHLDDVLEAVVLLGMFLSLVSGTAITGWPRTAAGRQAAWAALAVGDGSP